jgi:hypothetical protein
MLTTLAREVSLTSAWRPESMEMTIDVVWKMRGQWWLLVVVGCAAQVNFRVESRDALVGQIKLWESSTAIARFQVKDQITSLSFQLVNTAASTRRRLT